RHSDMRNVARSLTGIAVSLYDSGELDGAIANYRRALELFRRIEDQRFEQLVLLSLATLHTHQDKLDEAESFARACRDRATAAGDTRFTASADTERARRARARGDAKTAPPLAQGGAPHLRGAGDVYPHGGAR